MEQLEELASLAYESHPPSYCSKYPLYCYQCAIGTPIRSFCDRHGDCSLCQDAFCWCSCGNFQAQCPYAVHQQHPQQIQINSTTMEQPEREGNIPQLEEQPNLNCGETLDDSTSPNYQRLYTRRGSPTRRSPSTTPESIDNNPRTSRSPQRSGINKRTAEEPPTTSPNTHSEKRLRSSNTSDQHEQSNEPTIHHSPNHQHSSTDNELAASIDNNPTTKSGDSRNLLLHSQSPRSNNSASEDQNILRPTRNTEPLDGTDGTLGNIILQCGHGNSSAVNTTNDTTRSDLDERNGSTSSSDRTWTFVIHKSNLTITDTPITGHAPSYLRFDHGDHYHVIFAGNERGTNVAKSRLRICRHLTATDRGITEATATTQQVRNTRNFLQYCVRKGLHTFSPINTRTNQHLTHLQTELLQLPTNQGELEQCLPYIERKQQTKKHNKEVRTNIVDLIRQLLIDYDITSYVQFQQRVPANIRTQLLSEYSMTSISLTKELIKIRKTEEQSTLKHQSYRDICYNYVRCNLDTYQQNEQKINENIRWISNLLDQNNINLVEFLAWIEIIKNLRYQKINALVLYGTTNAGKSLFIRNATKLFKPTEISRERDNNSFHLDQLPYATGALFEEPMITPTNVSTWKLLLEGADVVTDIKNADKETIGR